MLIRALKSVNVISIVAPVISINADFQASGNVSSGMSNPLTKVPQLPEVPPLPVNTPRMSATSGLRCPVHSLKIPIDTVPTSLDRLAVTADRKWGRRPGDVTSQYGVINPTPISPLATTVRMVHSIELVDTIT